MPFNPDLFLVSISPKPAGIVLGKTGTVTVSASNFNNSDWGYNLTLQMILPDGVSYGSSTIPPTSQTNNPDGTIILIWDSIKDLAPNETGYTFPVTLQADQNFRATGLPVPFDIPLTPVTLSATVDTKPRGNAETGNIQYTKIDSTSVIPLRYAISKSAPGKMPKGASTPPPAAWPYLQEIVVDNNTREASLVNLSDVMDNGIRFIGPITAVGLDAAQFMPPNPVVITPSPGGQDFVSINWNNVTLSVGAVNTIDYYVAIWDNYTVGGVENAGSRILHLTPLNNTATLTGASGPVSSTGTTQAMDLTIDKSQTPTMLRLDTGTIINYTLTYRVNQYDGINAVVVTDVISDGQTYQVGSAVPPPTSVSAKDPLTGETTVVWDLGALVQSTSGVITFSTIVDTFYSAPPPDRPVVAGDSVRDSANINGTNSNFGTPAPDNSSSSGYVSTPSISKEILGFFYKDGTPKPPGENALAPGDIVQFRITYSAPFMADQKDVYIDDFFPFMLDATTISSIVYNPIPPATGPLPTGNNGVEWFLAAFVPGEITWTVTFNVSVSNSDFTGFLNNLVKMKGTNTDGSVYSARGQIPVDFGQPDMILTKAVVGPTPTAIQAGQTYTYTVVISNPQNIDGTIVDAFDLDFTDIIPDFLTYVPASLTAIASGGTPSFNPPAFSPPNQIAMHINRLKPDDQITVTYQVTVDAGIGPGLSLTNAAHTTSPYSQPYDPLGTNYQYPGLDRSASQTLTSADPTMSKTVDSSDKLVGDTVIYTLSWTITAGITAYDVVISDAMPIGQSYDNNALPVPPASVIGQAVTWPAIASVVGPATLVYSFRASIDSAVSVPPTYIDVQTNKGKVNWNAAPGELPNSSNASADVNVRNPHLSLLKEVRNVSQGGAFASSVTALGNEIIEYRLTVTNNGSADAYVIQIIDQTGGLSPGLSFIIGSLVVPPGTTSSYSPGLNLITWNIPVLLIGNSMQMLFRAKTSIGFPPATIIPNLGTGDSYSNINMIVYPPENSNPANVTLLGGVRGISMDEIISSGKVIIIKD